MKSGATEDGSVHVVGTAHVSEQSVEEVEEVIEDERPDIVAVELDEGRYRQMKGEHPDDLDAGDLLRGNTVFQFLAYWMLSYMQSRLGDKFDIDPGAEMMAGVETAEELGLGVALVDRDIQVTIQRFWARLSAREKLQLVSELGYSVAGGPVIGLYIGFSLGLFGAIIAEAFGGPFVLAPLGTGPIVNVFDTIAVTLAVGSVIGLALTLLFSAGNDPADTEEIEEFDLEELTDGDVVTAMMEEFRRFSPGGAEALIDERDAYIAHKLVSLQASGKDVVAVVGAGHRAGIEEYLVAPETLPSMESLTGEQQRSRFSWYKVIGYLFALMFLAFFVLIAMAGVRSEFFLKLVGTWFLFNGLLTFTLSRLGGAHWSSATVGGALAWLTSLNPMLAPGWFAGYVELRYTSVNVADIATLNEILDDEESPLMDLLARMRQVPLFKLILVVGLTNIGSFIGTWLFVMAVPYIVGDVSVVQLMLEGAQQSYETLMNGLRGVL